MTLAIYFIFVAVLLVLATFEQPIMLIILPVFMVVSYAILALIARFLNPLAKSSVQNRDGRDWNHVNSRYENGMRWLKWGMPGFLIFAVVKVLFAFGHQNPGQRIVDAVLLVIVGGGIAFVLGWALGGKSSDQSKRTVTSPIAPSSNAGTAMALNDANSTAGRNFAGTKIGNEVSPLRSRPIPIEPIRVESPPVAGSANSCYSGPAQNDAQLFEQALEEFDSGQALKSILARAIVESNGEDGKARAAYIRFRVSKLSAEREAQRLARAQSELQEMEKAKQIAQAEAERIAIAEATRHSSSLEEDIRQVLQRKPKIISIDSRKFLRCPRCGHQVPFSASKMRIVICPNCVNTFTKDTG